MEWKWGLLGVDMTVWLDAVGHPGMGEVPAFIKLTPPHPGHYLCAYLGTEGPMDCVDNDMGWGHYFFPFRPTDWTGRVNLICTSPLSIMNSPFFLVRFVTRKLLLSLNTFLIWP